MPSPVNKLTSCSFDPSAEIALGKSAGGSGYKFGPCPRTPSLPRSTPTVRTMNSLAELVQTLRTISGGLTLSSLAAFIVDGIPFFIQAVQLSIYTVIYTLLHFGPFGSMQTVGGGGYEHATQENGKTRPTMCPYAKRSERYPYTAPNDGDDRSPCPALNTLANHGFMCVYCRAGVSLEVSLL